MQANVSICVEMFLNLEELLKCWCLLRMMGCDLEIVGRLMVTVRASNKQFLGKTSFL